MMQVSLVSIIIPVYNSQTYIAAAIQSALDQTWQNIELIVVDDGSTDNSLAIAKTFENKRVKIFHHENKGASATRNKGLFEASGSYIQFLDADDLISPNKIEAQVKLLNDHPGYISDCSTAFFFETGSYLDQEVFPPIHSEKEFSSIEYLMKLYGGESGSMTTVHSWLTPRNIIDKAGYWNEELTVDDDGEFFFRIILNAAGVISCNEAVNYYRKHAKKDNLSAQLSLKAYQSMLLSASLKHQYFLNAKIDQTLANKIFSKVYWRTGVASFPQYRQLSKEALNKARKYNYQGAKYQAGPLSTLLSKIVGWRLVRLLTFIRYGV